MRQGHTTSELLASLVICLLVAAIFVFAVLINGQKHEYIKPEAVGPTTVHPISGEFSTGYILVELWIDDSEMKTPNGVKGVKRAAIVRMKRSEYLELMNQTPVTLQ